MNQDQKRADIVRGLRQAADMLSDTNTPLPYDVTIRVYWQVLPDGTLGDAVTQDIAREVMGRNPGAWSKGYAGGYVEYARTLSEFVSYELNVPRETVCRRIVTGQQIVPERTVDIVTWDCGGE